MQFKTCTTQIVDHVEGTRVEINFAYSFVREFLQRIVAHDARRAVVLIEEELGLEAVIDKLSETNLCLHVSCAPARACATREDITNLFVGL